MSNLHPSGPTCRLRLLSLLLCASAVGCSQTPLPTKSVRSVAAPTAELAPPTPELHAFVAAEPAGMQTLRVAEEAPAVLKPVRGTRRADFLTTQPSPDARHVADWVVDSGDHEQLPFIIVDKVEARIHVFGADGRLRASSPVLLGLARGDHNVPGIGEKKIADIRPEERTTPAGRFVAEMGHNAKGEDILWVDYDSAVSMHRVRPTVKSERRLERLASATPKDNRISYGCINVPIAFYERQVKPLFEPRNGIVYVLPETQPASAVFGSYDVAAMTPGR